jgi:hypothetical protein
MARQFHRFSLILIAAIFLHGELHAQTTTSPANPGVPQDPQAITAAMEAAKAAAARPGDDALSCEQLQEELGAAATDPAIQAKVQTAGEQAQKDMAAMEQAQSEIANQTATTVAGSLVPGASMGAMAATAANAEAAKARGAEHMKSRMAQGTEMMAALPALMRGQRLMELAVAKKCDWAAGIDPGTGAVKPAG